FGVREGGDGRVDAPWLAGAILDAGGSARRRLDTLLFAQRALAGSGTSEDAVISALEAFLRYPALMLTLEGNGTTDAVAYANAGKAAERLGRDDDVLGVFQSSVAILDMSRRAGTLPAAQARAEIATLSAAAAAPPLPAPRLAAPGGLERPPPDAGVARGAPARAPRGEGSALPPGDRRSDVGPSADGHVGRTALHRRPCRHDVPSSGPRSKRAAGALARQGARGGDAPRPDAARSEPRRHRLCDGDGRARLSGAQRGRRVAASSLRAGRARPVGQRRCGASRNRGVRRGRLASGGIAPASRRRARASGAATDRFDGDPGAVAAQHDGPPHARDQRGAHRSTVDHRRRTGRRRRGDRARTRAH